MCRAMQQGDFSDINRLQDLHEEISK